jgi:hypothetical protein
MDLTVLFCNVDDFAKSFQGKESNITITTGKSKRGGVPRMFLSELMTIIIAYHASGFKNFKAYYFYLREHKRSEFPQILSYTRFIEWIPYCLIPLCSYLNSRKGKCTGIEFIDSTPIKVCRNIRIKRNKVFKEIAKRGKSSMGWFFGFKLHIIVNEIGELLSFKITKGNTDDRVPVKDLCKGLFGKLYGDRGYIGKELFHKLWENGIQLISNIRSNMKNQLLPLEDKLMLRKRFIIETINDQLKNISDIEHSRHRSPVNFMVNLVAGLISYTWQPKKPAIKMAKQGLALV